MSKTLDMICKCRDLLTKEQAHKLPYFTGTNGLFDKTTERINQEVIRKTNDTKREIDFTAQDLREWAQDIKALLKRWDYQLDAVRGTKALLKEVRASQDGRVQFDDFSNKHILPTIELRRDSIVGLYRTLSIIEHHAIYLYFLEAIAKDELALKYTERF